MATNTKVISPGSTIGILGAGQLGKMSLVAAHQLGYRTAVWAPEGDIPAMEMATHRIVAPFNDAQAFDEMCRVADVITTEWENIPVELLQKLEARGKLVRPSSKILSIAQSRSTEKMFALDNNIDPTPWMYIPSHSDVLDKRYQVDVLLPGILKTDRNGYDGKGQFAVQTWEDVLSHTDRLKQPCVLEKKIPLDCEMSVLVARNASGEVKVSDVVHNTHINGILSVSSWSRFGNVQMKKACAIALKAADVLQLEGILAFEFFVSERVVYFNEMAPRPHNSFHGSIEAAYTSQFEQHIRAICNLPLGDVHFHTAFQMTNLIGGSLKEWHPYLTEKGARIHLYGKKESRPDRKMGHVTQLLKK